MVLVRHKRPHVYFIVSMRQIAEEKFRKHQGRARVTQTERLGVTGRSLKQPVTFTVKSRKKRMHTC